MKPTAFAPKPPASGVVSWLHLGDLHMTRAGEQNDLDLQAIVAQINAVMTSDISFVYLPGDIADDGSREAYAVVRAALDRLELPWTGIVGDHDVHERSYVNFREAIAEQTHGSFSVAGTRFLRLNAFDEPRPDAFLLRESQLAWLEEQLGDAEAAGEHCVLLLHCYPSDLKSGGERLSALLGRHRVLLIDMGHTHYNEIANDGRTIYSATRSTGQVEEGAVGFSVASVDGGAVSWNFIELGREPALTITYPADLRLIPEQASVDGIVEDTLSIRAKAWSGAGIERVEARLGGEIYPLARREGTSLWSYESRSVELEDGVHELVVWARDASGGTGEDRIRIAVGREAMPHPRRKQRDQDNFLAWPEHALLGTQLGPNKNGRKW